MRVVLFLLCVVLIGCSKAAEVPKNIQNAGVERQSTTFLDYGNGLYYFPMVHAPFGNALSSFLASHPCPNNFSFTGNGTGVYGFDTGYWVVCR